ncbi:MarR family winged helix-turn-helix transcriptional regulator [Lentibacillus cibarius]|uniref:MarR family transcriptional regulator n=1 Tax=Lentibacillus cibarius TaxID=2583219 RepID=A0A5S3QJV8_9BACI|nr:MarR family transcriptional regulator [Lentibacillus cibarius]TMN22222.1 MarR family transcriptional regulator [Lentibacillus cibarius]
MGKDMYEVNRPMALMQSFWQLQKSIMTQVKQTAADNDLSVPQFAILVMMQHNKQISQKKLQARTHYPKSTLSHAIDGLVQADLLNRSHVEGNRREMNVSLSDRGKELLDDMKSQEDGVHSRFNNAVNSFTEEQFNELIHMHQHIVSFFEGGGTE